jgi:putative aldouronate transport system substrate-binding protein
MNKSKKIAVAVVATVMAGTIVLPLAGCKKTGDLDPSTDKNGQLTWAEGTTLNLNIGNANSTAAQGISYLDSDLSGSTVLPDGKTYVSGDLKPAWQAMSDQLGITFVDKYQNLSSDKQITTPITNNELAEYDVITGSLSSINENADNFLNLTDYLDYMPNYKAFLESNPVTEYSLTGNSTGAMYAAPYFDGNDDIEKYSMVNYLWVYDILDNDIGTKYTATYKEQLVAKGLAKDTDTTIQASATAYMMKTGSYTIDTTDPSDTTGATVIKLKVNYDAAKAAAQKEDSALGAAIAAAAGKAYTTDSGNIVDIQNFAINETNGAVTGAQLAKILREYIKVAYQKTDGTAFYSKLSDVFCSAGAGWDVDLLVGMSRCVVTCARDLTSSAAKNTEKDGKVTAGKLENVYAISARQTTTQRRVDLSALAGELYGVRGMESRYEYTYFDANGQIQDARLDADSYTLINNMNALTKEGLVYIGDVTKKSDGTVSASTINTKDSATQTFMLHDYVQTQTKYGITDQTDTSKYNFAPIVNAISKWDTTGDGNHETNMRFTESWRSVKNTGFCIPIDAVKGNNDKLAAVLAFVDYLFSTDGQLLMSYGPQSTNNTDKVDGWWYANEVTDKTPADVADVVAEATNYAPTQYSVKSEYKSQYFVYNEKVYTGFSYNGTQVPILTDLNKSFYVGKTVKVGETEIKQGAGNIKVSKAGDYTNYARYIIGSTLPIGNKNQGFEYQATADCGIAGANTVAKAILNGTIKHVKLTLSKNESAWYLITPTALPLSSTDRALLKNDEQTLISGTYFLNSSSTSQITNVYIDLIYYGLGSTNYLCATNTLGTYETYNTGAKLVELLKTKKMSERLTATRDGWYILNSYYELGYELD